VRARHLAWGTTAMTAGLAVGTVAFGFQNDGTPLPADEGEEIVSFAGELAYSVTFAAFAALGPLFASRRPRNPIGWLLCLSPLSLGVSGLVTGWYVRAFYAAPGSAAPPDGLLWLGGWIWVFGFPPLVTALLLLFPAGRLPSRGWLVAFVANTMLDQVLGVTSDFLLLPFLLALTAAATVAILRYRLYDLGRIVNRTLVYGGLTLMLAATYLGLVRGTGHRRARDGATRPSDVVAAPVTMPGRGATRMRT
jgi:hypothetical protein